jgi:hypothetical protein
MYTRPLFFSLFFFPCVYQHFIKTININTFYLNIYTSTHVYVFISTNSSWKSTTFEAFPLIQIVSLCIEQLKIYIYRVNTLSYIIDINRYKATYLDHNVQKG